MKTASRKANTVFAITYSNTEKKISMKIERAH